jgi:hypothetical protein
MIPDRWIILWDGKPIGISDGYPCKSVVPACIEWFLSRETAENYVKVFENSRSYGFYIPRVEVVRIQFRIIP